MAGVNKVIIVGRAGRDPEMKYVTNGTAVVEFSVAVDGYAKQGQKPEPEWFNVVAWDKLGETVNQLVTKGRLVYVEGRQQTRTWEKQDGTKGYRTELIATSVQMLDPKPAGQERAPVPSDDNELPF